MKDKPSPTPATTSSETPLASWAQIRCHREVGSARAVGSIGAGSIRAWLKTRHRHQEFVAFCKQVARAYIDGWDDRCHRFIRTNTADQILKSQL
jgi:hypothetical protein